MIDSIVKGTGMTSPRNGSPTRALVLGGGGAVGVGWQTGLLTGLREAGADLAAGDEAFRSAIGQASLDTGPRQALRAIGRAAQEASTPAEDVYLGLFGTLDGTAWPAGFRCTAINTDSGDLVV